jgi:hypothetical protein
VRELENSRERIDCIRLFIRVSPAVRRLSDIQNVRERPFASSGGLARPFASGAGSSGAMHFRRRSDFKKR